MGDKFESTGARESAVDVEAKKVKIPGTKYFVQLTIH
jgi:hypothetical protein